MAQCCAFTPRVRDDLCHTRRSLVVVILLGASLMAFSMSMAGLTRLPTCVPEIHDDKGTSGTTDSVGCYFVNSVCAVNHGASDEVYEVWENKMASYNKWKCGDCNVALNISCNASCKEFPLDKHTGFASRTPPVKPAKIVTCMDIPKAAQIVQNAKGQKLAIPFLATVMGLIPILTCGIAFIFRNQRTMAIAIESTKVMSVADTSMLVFSFMYVDELTFDCRWRGSTHPEVDKCRSGWVLFAIGASLFAILNAFMLVLCITMGERERRRLADSNVTNVADTVNAVQTASFNRSSGQATAAAVGQPPNGQANFPNSGPAAAPGFKESA